MTTVTDTASAASTAAAAAGTKPKNEAQALNDRFLKLLVAQMNNQDPLNPLDNAQVTSQMAQINTVTGINGLNDTVQQLLTQFSRLETMQAAQLTGRDVLVNGNTVSLGSSASGARSVGAGYVLDVPADKVKVEVRDANGALVRTLDLGARPEGLGRFDWDGKTDEGGDAAAGKYSINVTAAVGGKESAATALAVRRVEGVRQDPAGVQLVLTGGGVVAYSDIKQIL